MKEKIQRIIDQAVADEAFPGCVVGVVWANGERFVLPSGNFTFDPGSEMIKEDSIFDVASITKAIPTSSLALQLIDEGRLSIDDRLIAYVPEFRNAHREGVLIRHLLTQTLDFGFRLSDFKDRSAQEILEVIFTTEFKSAPGTTFFYTNATSILLGLVVERIYGESLDVLGEEHFFGPLQMNRTGYNPLNRFPMQAIVPTEIQEWRGGLVQGEVHDESAYVLGKEMAVGSAGVFSTAPDMLNFLEMLLNDGAFDSKRYLSSEMMAQIQTNQISHIGECAGLGWELNQPRYMGKFCTETTFGKTGFTGCNVVCDIERGIAFVILSNYTYPKRKIDATQINAFRSAIADIILGE